MSTDEASPSEVRTPTEIDGIAEDWVTTLVGLNPAIAASWADTSIVCPRSSRRRASSAIRAPATPNTAAQSCAA